VKSGVEVSAHFIALRMISSAGLLFMYFGRQCPKTCNIDTMPKSRSTNESDSNERNYKNLPVTRRESETGSRSPDPQEGKEGEHPNDNERNWDRPVDPSSEQTQKKAEGGDAKNDPELPEDRPVGHSDKIYADPRNNQRGYGQGAGSSQKVAETLHGTVEGKRQGDAETQLSSSNIKDDVNEELRDPNLVSHIGEGEQHGPNSFMQPDQITKDPKLETKEELGPDDGSDRDEAGR